MTASEYQWYLCIVDTGTLCWHLKEGFNAEVIGGGGWRACIMSFSMGIGTNNLIMSMIYTMY